MKKLITFLRYAKDFIKHGEFHYLLSSVKYMLTGKTTRKEGLYHSDLGVFYARRGTLDFQFGNSAYEKNVKDFVSKYVNHCNKFLDIGANIGTYSIFFAKQGLTGCAFEPSPENFQALKQNIDLNHLTEKVQLYELGLGDHHYIDEFSFDPINTGATHTSSVVNPDAIEGKKEKVKIVTLDSLIHECQFDPEKDKVLVKIDVEGMEINVIEGAKNFLQTFPEIVMVIETVHSGAENIKKKLQEIDRNFNFVYVDDLNIGAVKSSKK